MKIIETIPCYTTTIGLDIIIGIGALLILIAFSLHECNWAPVIGIGGVLILLICLGLYNLFGIGKTYSHDEYAVELTDMSAAEFYAQYEVIKQYEYSNVWRVREK